MLVQKVVIICLTAVCNLNVSICKNVGAQYHHYTNYYSTRVNQNKTSESAHPENIHHANPNHWRFDYLYPSSKEHRPKIDSKLIEDRRAPQSHTITLLSKIIDAAKEALNVFANELDLVYRKAKLFSRNDRKSRQDSSFFSIGSQLASSGAWALPAAGLATAGVFREEIASLIEDIFGESPTTTPGISSIDVCEETVDKNSCPLTHPYAFSEGRECCKTGREANGVARSLSAQPRHPHNDETCDGSVLLISSNCCEEGAMLRCPSFSTNNIPCTNGDPTGIGKCEPLNFCWKGYNSSCCTSDAPCGYRQGGCSTNNQCSGQLICGTTDCGSGFDTTNLGQKCCHYPVCGTTTCSITSTKSNCGTASADCISAFYTGSYTFLQADSNGQPIYYKAATLNGIPLNYFLYLFFVPEINVWTINTNIALSANLANERSPLAYYSNDAFCVQDVSGSSWTLSNPFTSSTETDSTMQVSCS